ncbi:MAG: bifunctional phosphopantothenoylcysteine decarboxylase/phosphopantothenate--cysteine ligase CoaBC [Anaerolineae bacterium]|nr:bifunctional phosphopantothenoylcysteine decarboxylase/phosphopantothenate--cysteine ligase CoaBC [Anaerolineae bacterium]
MQDNITLLQDKRILLGITGSIACYKVVDLASKLTQAGALVDVIMTRAAQQFVTPLTFQAVTGRSTYTDMWQTDSGGALPTHIAHVGLAEGADLLAVIPATADTIARLDHGFANDLLAVTALAARCPLLIAPAMDGAMYSHPAVQANLETLRVRGAWIIEPEEGRFASGLVGQGRLPETPTLMGAIRQTLGANGALAGRRVIVTAGGTREPLDPVRYLTNRSSGKQGYALAQAAVDAGATVTLITSARGLPVPYGVEVVSVESAAQLHDAVLRHVANADALAMAAAVADFRPQAAAPNKIKKSELDQDAPAIQLERTADILAAVKQQRAQTGFPRVTVGFAAESQELLTYARDKIVRKGVDLLVANDISAADAGFDVDTNRVIILDADGEAETLPLASKAVVSEIILQRVAKLLEGR